MYKLGRTSLSRLNGVHSDLVRVVKRAIEITKQDFTVIEGLRTFERQKALIKENRSRTMKSNHLIGHAVDIAPFVDGKISWEHQHFYPLALAMFTAAKEFDICIRWGSDWNGNGVSSDERFVDCPHFELYHKTQPRDEWLRKNDI